MKGTGTNTAQRMSAIMMTDRFHCRLTWTEAVLEMMMYGFDDNDKTMASSTIIPTASTRPNSVRVLTLKPGKAMKAPFVIPPKA
jgi:hypothetical protein